MLYFGAGLLAIPFWDWIAKRFGKHRSLATAMVLVGMVSIGVLTVKEGQLPKFYVLFALEGLSASAPSRTSLGQCWRTSWTSIPFESGAARPASYFAILGFVTKCAASFGGLSLPILAFVGYSTDPGGRERTHRAHVARRVVCHRADGGLRVRFLSLRHVAAE